MSIADGFRCPVGNRQSEPFNLNLLPSCHAFCLVNLLRGGWRWRRFRDLADAERFLGFRLDAGEEVFVLFQELAGVFTALSDALGLVAEPGAGLLHDIVVHGEIEQVAFTRNALTIKDVELGFAERGGGLILYHLPLSA